MNLLPKGEPQLGKRGLYPSIGAQATGSDLMDRLWVLNLSDGRHSLMDVAERARRPFSQIRDAARTLESAGLLQPQSPQARPGSEGTG